MIDFIMLRNLLSFPKDEFMEYMRRRDFYRAYAKELIIYLLSNTRGKPLAAENRNIFTMDY